MRHLRHLVVAVVLPAVIIAAFAVSTVLAGGPAGKTTICHFASHKYVEITVSDNALPAHFRHGDAMPDEYGDCP